MPAGIRVALVSSEVWRERDEDLPLLEAAMARRRIHGAREVWDDPAVDWAGYDLVVVRSCWDYTWRLERFLGWARTVPRLANPYPVLAWNTDKTYLADLAAAGIPVVPTAWAPEREDDLAPLGAGHAEWVVKPTVSAGARDTARWPSTSAALEHARALAGAGRVAMVQPYQASVDEQGETALVFCAGTFTHAVRKRALLGRGEGPRGDRDGRGDPGRHRPGSAELELARDAVRAVQRLVVLGKETLLYARVDVVEDGAGAPAVLECELVEPSLFLPQHPAAADVFAAAMGELVAARS